MKHTALEVHLVFLHAEKLLSLCCPEPKRKYQNITIKREQMCSTITGLTITVFSVIRKHVELQRERALESSRALEREREL